MSMFGGSGRYGSTSARRGTRGYRGRGSTSGRWQSGAKTTSATSRANQEPVGKLLLTIRPELERTSSKEVNATIKGCQYVASYNWLDGKALTILVPGSPPTWTPPVQTMKLSEDKGSYYRDMNAAHYSAYPLEPAIRALLMVEPDYKCPTVDIVGCGSTMGSLLSACSLSDERTFNFGVEKIGNTIFLVRQTPATELIENVYGYGHSFPEAYTTWPRDVKNSASHQRLVEYSFAGFRCLIRSESDGYLPEKITPRPVSEGRMPDVVGKPSLEEATDTLTVSNPFEAATSKLVVRSAGQAIPQKAIFDLKTRSLRRDINTDEFLPQLWVNQTSNFILARHNSGVFQEIEIKDMKSDIQRWETTNRIVLLRLHYVLKKLVDLTSQDGLSRVQVHRVGTGPLLVSETANKWTVLPPDLKARWQGKEFEFDDSDERDSEDENEDYLKF